MSKIKQVLHPCYNCAASKSGIMRMHLPIADKCNIKCKHCRSDIYCSNENFQQTFPGQAREVITPQEAFERVCGLKKDNENYKVVGFAGPGDPLANPYELFKTVELVRNQYSDIEFCISTNGLEVQKYLYELMFYGIKYITITINTLNADIGAQIYDWCLSGKKVLYAKSAATNIIEAQRTAVEELNKHKEFLVKVNTVYIPEVNSLDIENIIDFINENGVYIYNLVPLVGENIKNNNLIKQEVALLRKKYSNLTNVMMHCKQCRSDDISKIV